MNQINTVQKLDVEVTESNHEILFSNVVNQVK
jgi:hypothetical protein